MSYCPKVDITIGPCPNCATEPEFVWPLLGKPHMRCSGCGARGPTVSSNAPRSRIENGAEEAWNQLIRFEQPDRGDPPPPAGYRAAPRTRVLTPTERMNGAWK